MGVTGAVDPVLARAVGAAAAARQAIEAEAEKLRAALVDVADFYAHPSPERRAWPMPNGLVLVFRQGRKRTWGFYVDRYHSSELSLPLLLAVAKVLEAEAPAPEAAPVGAGEAAGGRSA